MTTPHNIFYDTTGIEITPAIDRAIKAIIKQAQTKTVSKLAPKDGLEHATQVMRNIGMLRQWLNEDKVANDKPLVTNEDIIYWLTLEK